MWLIGLLLLLLIGHFWIQVNELKKGANLSTGEAIKRGLKSVLFLILMFCMVLVLFIVYTYYRIL